MTPTEALIILHSLSKLGYPSPAAKRLIAEAHTVVHIAGLDLLKKEEVKELPE